MGDEQRMQDEAAICLKCKQVSRTVVTLMLMIKKTFSNQNNIKGVNKRDGRNYSVRVTMLDTPVSPLEGLLFDYCLGDLFMPLEVYRRFCRPHRHLYPKIGLKVMSIVIFPSLVRRSVTFWADICALNEVNELCIAEVQSSCNVMVGECSTRQNWLCDFISSFTKPVSCLF